jgi:riboflavin synthase
MFTGLIQDVGVVRRLDRRGELVLLTVETRLAASGFAQGESVAVDGVCLTVISSDPRVFQAEISPETLERTALGTAGPGRQVNLERALRLTDRLGGHLVTGHIDGTGTIERRRLDSRCLELEIRVPVEMGRYLVEKGSVAVDGVSLTVNRCGRDWFGLNLIPHTIQETTLSSKAKGAIVNVECDILGKYVEKFLQGRLAGPLSPGGGVTEDLLRTHGFTS